MSYDYSSESKRLELPNPYQLQNRLLWLCAAVLLIGGIVALFWARAAMQENALRLVAGPLVAGLAMIAAGLVCAATSARRMRFFFGRGRPSSLAPDLPVGAVGNSKAADAVKEILRQGSITYPEPHGAVEGMLYHWAPKLITSPAEVQFQAQRYVFNLAAIVATLVSFLICWALFGNAVTRPWIGLLYFAFGLFVLLKPVVSGDRAKLSQWTLVGLIAAAILAPVAIGLIGSRLPSLHGFEPTVQTFVMLIGSLIACGVAVVAILAQVDSAPQTRASVVQERLSMNAPPASLMDELDRLMQSAWTEAIPNRRYARIDPVTNAATPSGSFAGELFEESQPLPAAGTKPPTFAAAIAEPRHRALLLLDLYATVLVIAAVVMSLAFVRQFDVSAAWRDNRFSLIGTSAILAVIAAFCFQAASRLWGRFNFESVLTWVEMVGTYQTSHIGTGNNFSSRMNTENDVIRTEAMTLRIWRARIESVVFGKDAVRQVTAMFSTEQEAHALSSDLTNFARSQSVLVAPNSREDQARIAALNAGERAVLPPGQGAGAAAQVQQHLHAAAAIASVGGVASVASATAAKRFCSACGTEAPAGARFCANCAAPIAG
jgi:hypothetical protein